MDDDGRFDVSALPRLPVRDPAGHKGTFGTVGVIGGCARREGDARMLGAPALAGRAALRSGVGLVKIAAPEPVLDAVLTIEPSAIGVAIPVGRDQQILAHEAAAVVDQFETQCTCIAIGPGLGRGDGPRGAVLRAIQREDVPIVVDADGLNELAQINDVSLDFHAAAVLTPHPGEFKRLAGAMKLSQSIENEQERADGAAALAQRLGCVVVLKGQRTVVSDGMRTWVNTSGHACMATAGTGDVLTGLIAGLIAQHAPKPMPAAMAKLMAQHGKAGLSLYDAARLGVHIHGLAGELWAQRHDAEAGLVATELADLLPEIVQRFREQTAAG